MGLAVIGCGPQKSLSPIHSAHSFRSSLTPDSHELRGLASYYGRKFHGRRTASGEKYHRQQLTAAHRTIPFGTMVKVINLENDQSVIVRINDRGPFVKGRVIDLSYAAAKHIGMISKGIISVVLEIVD